MLKKIFFLFVLGQVFIPFFAHAQIELTVWGGTDRKFPIAVPQFMTEDGGHSASTKELTDLLKKDLAIAGIFKVIDEASMLSKDNDTQNVDFSGSIPNAKKFIAAS